MTQVAIRQSGGASIISIPKVILRTLALDAGASLDLSRSKTRRLASGSLVGKFENQWFSN